MKDEQFRAYDSATGERLAVINLTDTAKKNKGKRRFVMVFVDIPSYTTNKALSDFDTRLLMFLVCNMNESNEVRLMQDEIAKELDVYQPRVSKSLARLRETNYVTTPRRGVVQISPEFAWRDSLAENAKARGKR